MLAQQEISAPLKEKKTEKTKDIAGTTLTT